MVKSCDLVIAGNDYLKEKAMKYNERITVVPTPIDTGRYSKKLYGKKARVTLGWIGSHGTLFYLEKMKPVLDSLGKRFDHIELKIVCDHFFDCSNLPVIKKLWNYDEEIADLKSFDIGLMPLTDDPWSRGKCGFKLLQYLAVGVPVVCSPVGVNKQIVKDGKNGYLAKTESDWMEKLSLLIGSDEGLREDMGMNGRKVVDTEYSLEVNSPKLLEALKV
jgi:glycosyltransferase involved in cell wall biosynthesis